MLTAVGVTSIAQNDSIRHRMLAVAPLLFAAQQFAEGIVWSTFASPDQRQAHSVAVLVFLCIAMVVWPTWVPVSLWLAERTAARRRWLGALVLVGCVVSTVSGVMLVVWRPVATIAGHSITYEYAQGTNGGLSALLLLGYVAPTVGPFFVSTMRTSRTIGSTLLVSMVLAALVQRDALTSVWCFFAAMLSVQIALALRKESHVRAVAFGGAARRG